MLYGSLLKSGARARATGIGKRFPRYMDNPGDGPGKIGGTISFVCGMTEISFHD